jgi:hypothetical protein
MLTTPKEASCSTSDSRSPAQHGGIAEHGDMPQQVDTRKDGQTFQRGRWVHVKSPAEIKRTLDAEGSLDGLPFMPEMVQYCGRRLKIVRFANQVCAQVGEVEIRRLADAVVLDVERCDGCHHGGCEMGCDFIWKSQWLTPVDDNLEAEQKCPAGDAAVKVEPDGASQEVRDPHFHRHLVQISSVGGGIESNRSNVDPSKAVRYRCQATELGAASKQASAFNLQQYRVERQTNGTSLWAIGKFLCSTLVRKALGRDENCSGPRQRTPVADLRLEVGDRVRVKSFDQIVDTLDAKGCNRGLWFDRAEMKPFCGQTMTVTRKVTRILDERSGELLELKVPSVVLNETQCSGLKRRFCGRGMLHFWREVWVEKDGSEI